MTTEPPLASVIIPHLNQPDALDACLKSLAVQSLDRGLFEVIVVDNGSQTLPQTIVAAYPGVCLLQQLRPGPGLARNHGAASARGNILCFIDADCRAHADWLASALHALSSAPPHTVFGGDVRIWREDGTRFSAIEAYESVFAYRFKMYIERHGYSGTGNLAVRAADFRRAGPFLGIERAEDVEWGAQARAAGLTIRYEPRMIVYHPARRNLGELFVKWDRHLQHEFNAARTKRLWPVRWLLRASALVLSPLVDVGKIVISDRLQGPTSRIKATAVLIAVRGYRAWRMVTLLFSKQSLTWNRPMEVPSAGSKD